MEKEALQILWRAAELAQKAGQLSIQDAVAVNSAYNVLLKYLDKPKTPPEP